jgi:hypothetical protein
MSWRLAFSLAQLRNELNSRWPNRDVSSDGGIGNAAHAATASDHNPNDAGVVCAYDVDTDLDGTNDSNDPEMDALAEQLRTRPHPDVKYVIYRGRMFSRYPARGFAPFAWRPYPGPDPHTSHLHVSVGVGPDGHSAPGTYDDTTAWLAVPAPPAPPAELTKENPMHAFATPNGDIYVFAIGTDNAVWYRHLPLDGQWSEWITVGGVVRDHA